MIDCAHPEKREAVFGTDARLTVLPDGMEKAWELPMLCFAITMQKLHKG
ncbi:hypothetical protein CES86_5079 [Brucella lupini]|uniref:Uncharacterized protein n=1 Tax=Brucella lupini TaxID=255457 RepID=A0A256GCG3_9HYPH|nr:hypothetical protein CES86_5079 [Brucella lupini]